MGFNEVKGVRLRPQSLSGLTSNKGEIYYHSTLGIIFNDGIEKTLLGDVWPSYFADDETTLLSSITSANTNGGVICVRKSFSVTSGVIIIPTNTILIGKGYVINLTFNATSSFALSTEAQIRDITLTKSTGTIVTVTSAHRTTVKNVRFSGSGATTGININNLSTGNRLLRCQLVGGVSTLVFGVDNISEDIVAF